MFLIFVLLILHQPDAGSGSERDTSPIACYNDHEQAVDWYYLYKLPIQKGSNDSANGLKYLLMEMGSEGWVEGRVNADSTMGAPGRTVGQLYAEQNREVAYILYNDQHLNAPGQGFTVNTKGHTKGMVLLDKTQGFWLVHSTPCFPPRRENGQYSYPKSAMKNGQSFLCITFPLNQFQTIGEQLQINQAHVYDCDVPPSLVAMVPALATLCRPPRRHVLAKHLGPHVSPVAERNVTLNSGTEFLNVTEGSSFDDEEQLLINQAAMYDCDVPPSLAAAVPILSTAWECNVQANHFRPHVSPVAQRSVTLTSIGGTEFLSFAKGSSFNNDLYVSWVAPALKSHLLVRLWVCGRGVLPSSCSGTWKVMIVTVAKPGNTFPISAGKDHSKWAVSTQAQGSQGGGGWVCVGDINRIKAEEKRGGGTVCQQNPVVWKAYHSAALECNDCRHGTSCDV